MKNWTLTLLTVLSASLYSLPAYCASFDCHKASTLVEKNICNNPEISKLDEDLAKQYKAALKNAKGSEYNNPNHVRADQIRWLTFQRNTCLNESCLLREYKERLGCDENEEYCGKAYGRGDLVNDKAFGSFTEARRITLYNPDSPDKPDVFMQTNELDILSVSDRPYLAVIDMLLVFDNGHQCSVNEQLARWAQNHWVLSDTYNDKNIELRLYPVTKKGNTQMLIRDIDGQYRKANCGARGYFDGLIFEKQ